MILEHHTKGTSPLEKGEVQNKKKIVFSPSKTIKSFCHILNCCSSLKTTSSGNTKKNLCRKVPNFFEISCGETLRWVFFVFFPFENIVKHIEIIFIFCIKNRYLLIVILRTEKDQEKFSKKTIALFFKRREVEREKEELKDLRKERKKRRRKNKKKSKEKRSFFFCTFFFFFLFSLLFLFFHFFFLFSFLCFFTEKR